MNSRTHKCLIDIQEAGWSILAFSRNLTFDAFSEDDRTRAAVERKFEIIGEALRRVREGDSESFQHIQFGNDIVGMRNRLIHGYDAVDEAIVWETIQDYLPLLLADVARLLEAAN